MNEPADKSSQGQLGDIDPGVIVSDRAIDLTDYDSNITLQASGEYTLSGILNYSVLVNSDGPVTLNLSGVTISSVETSAIANQTTQPLTINLLENTTNTLTDGGASVYDGALFSLGELTINGYGDDRTLGKLIVSGRQDGGEGIATKSAPLTINSGKIMISSKDDGLNTGGDGGTITINSGILWIKAGGDAIDSNKNIVINGGNVLAISTESGDAALDSESGISINGGNVVALGKDMLESPTDSSNQKFLAITLENAIKNGSTVYIRNIDTLKTYNFKAEGEFKTLVFSLADLAEGTYEISVDGVVVGSGTVK